MSTIKLQTAKATKIRELLRGNAKNLIPDSVENIDDIYKVLDRAFGDPIRLLNYKKQSLSKIGAFPSYDIKGGHKVIVDWYLKLEIQLQDLLDLAQANSDDDDLTAAIYLLDIVLTVVNILEKQEGEAILASVRDQQGRVRLQILKDKISKRRTFAQKWQHIKEFVQTSPGPGKKTGTSPSTTNSNGHSPKSLVVYNPPRNNPDCRICQNLEFNGDTVSLYENHYSNFPTGCPRYIMMSMEDQAHVARLAKICLNCHNPDYRWKRQDKDHKCGTVSVNGKKGEPVFLLSKTEGKTSPLLTLWDSGCGSVLFEDGVPTKELGPAVLKTQCPIFINRVCDTTCKVNG